jgi:uncharacterized protein (DUF2147 family)
MKKITFLVCFLFIYIFVLAQNPNDIIGKWYTPEKDCIVEIYKSNNKYFGKIVWQKNQYNEDGSLKTDVNNSEPSLRSKALNGLIILKNFAFEDDAWEDGTIYNPLDGNNYDAIIKIIDDKTMSIRGFLGFSLLGKTTVWTKTTEI